jgi:hypothetical protein
MVETSVGQFFEFFKDSSIPILIYQNQLFEKFENWRVIEYIPNLINDGYLSPIV